MTKSKRLPFSIRALAVSFGAPAIVFLASACGASDAQAPTETGGTHAATAKTQTAFASHDERASANRGHWGAEGSALSLTSAADAWCPAGFTFNATYRLCESATEAAGPFPAGMADACKQEGGGSGCAGDRWNKRFAENLRGTGQCAKGTWLDTARAECTDGTNVFGPFSKPLVDACRNKGGGSVCSSMRWHNSFVDPQSAVRGTWNDRVLSSYSTSAGYDRVYNNVMGWYGTRSNGCTAFMSTALRLVGFDVPQNGMIDGYRVSLWVGAFSKYLTNKGWARVDNYQDLRPGDVVFTVGEPGDDANPLHTYMFQSWKDRVNKVGWVVDNQAFTHERDIFNYGSYNFSPFRYALRSRD